jgi:hypothetical protein
VLDVEFDVSNLRRLIIPAHRTEVGNIASLPSDLGLKIGDVTLELLRSSRVHRKPFWDRSDRHGLVRRGKSGAILAQQTQKIKCVPWCTRAAAASA